MGKIIFVLGLLVASLGGIMMLFERAGIPPLGQLPGDLVIKRDNFSLYVPIASSLFVSLILSFLFWALSRFR